MPVATKGSTVKHRAFLIITLMIGLGLTLTLQAQTPPAPTPTPEPGPITLTVWLPDELASADEPLARAEFNRQVQAFNASQDNIIVEVRLKMVSDTGGIMSTLRAASSVAPGALPDLTLLRRQELVPAQRDGLIQSFEGKLPPAQVNSLDTAFKLGQVNNQWVGLPYLLELEHLVYRPSSGTTEIRGWSYADMLERGAPMVFPAGRSTGISDIVYLQYLAAGGSLGADNILTYNADALETTLTFYEQASDSGVLDDRLANYTRISDYRTDFDNKQINTAIFFSPDFLQLLESDRTLRAAPIPTITGQNIAMLDGWMWVLIASETEHQDAAIRFLTFLMQADNQAAYASTLNLLPSQRTILIETLPTAVDSDMYLNLLDNAVLPLAESEGGPLASSLQEAVEAILKGDQTAEDALRLLDEQHSGS
jgi:ABC-type glycerol-3-phosphate transport system substrate-binding protein